MRIVASELVTVGFFVLVGWAALWPARRGLGPFGYHIAALPVGLLSAALAGAFAAFSNRPLDALSALAGGALLVAVVQAFLRIAVGATERSGSFDLRSFLVAGGAIGALAAIVGFVRLTVTNNDSIVSYWPLGVDLSREGAFTAALIASRSALIPSMSAIHVTFGSDWAYVIYPMLGATMLAWLAFTLVTGPLSMAARRTVQLVTGGAIVALVIEPSFIFHSLFVHSHMISGLYLLMALTCLWMGVRQDGGRATSAEDARAPASVAYLVLAGAFTAGLAHGRPDGLAYQFVPVVAAISVLTLTKVEWRQVLAFFGPLLVIVCGVYAAALVDMGVWDSAKLSGPTTLGILAVLVFSATGPWIAQGIERLTRIKLTGQRFFAVVVSAATILAAAVLVLHWDTAGAALATARINLFQGAGGYHYLWYGVAALLVLSVFTRDALRSESWTQPAFLSIALFFIVAGVVHGLSHEGRVGVGDSFNRVAFHALPLVVWFVAAVVARILTSLTEEPDEVTAPSRA